jgi:hypothetical protein
MLGAAVTERLRAQTHLLAPLFLLVILCFLMQVLGVVAN